MGSVLPSSIQSPQNGSYLKLENQITAKPKEISVSYNNIQEIFLNILGAKPGPIFFSCFCATMCLGKIIIIASKQIYNNWMKNKVQYQSQSFGVWQ